MNEEKKNEKEVFYNKLISELTEEEKKLNSSFEKIILLDNKNYLVQKEINVNYLTILDENKNIIDMFYLGETIFKYEKEFTPLCYSQLNEFLKDKRGKYTYYLDSIIKTERDIYTICKTNNKKIIIEMKISLNNIEINENLFNSKKQKKNFDEITLEDLSLFYLYYFPEINENIKDFKYILSDERKNFYNNLLKKIVSPNNIIELYGPFGIGKSISLLAFKKKGLIKNSIYININAISKLENKEILLKLLLYESITLCDNFQQFKELEEYLSAKNTENDDVWTLIKKIIIYMSDKLINEFIIIIDQYKEFLKDSNFYIKQKLNDVLFNISGYQIIKCSSMDDTEVKNNFIKILENDNYIYIDKLINIYTQNEEEKIYFGNVYLFHYLYLKSKKSFGEFIEAQKLIIKKDIQNIIKRQFNNLLEAISNISNIIKYSIKFNEREIKSFILFLPVKYLKIKQLDKEYFIFEYSCFLLRLIFEELAIEEIKRLSNVHGLKEIRGILGGIFEIMCHFSILANKLNFNLNSKKLFYIENNIYCSSEKIENWKFKQKDSELMKNLDSIYIRPINSNSELYDSIIIFKEKENFSAYLLQMSISKDKGKAIQTRNKHIEASELVKKKLKIVYGIDINNIYFSYIFNYDEIKSEDIIECSRQNVDYFYYSMLEQSFYQLEIGNKINKPTKTKVQTVKNELSLSFKINSLQFTSLALLKKDKINLNLFKSQEIIKNEDNYFVEILGHKRTLELSNIGIENSSIIKNIKSINAINKVIPRNKSFKLEYEGNKVRIDIFYHYLYKNYFLLLKDENSNVYGITEKNVYELKSLENFEIVNTNLYQRIFSNKEEFDLELYSIV